VANKEIANTSGGPRSIENFYTESMLRAHFSELDIVSLQSSDRIIEEGPGHSGMSALIELVAVKPVSARMAKMGRGLIAAYARGSFTKLPEIFSRNQLA